MQCCSFCFGDVDPSDLANNYCSAYADHDPVCKQCLAYYIRERITSAFLGSCPIMHCPCVHPSKTKKLLRFHEWRGVAGSDSFNRYEKLAESIVAFLCGTCHALRSLLVRYDPNEAPQGRAELEAKLGETASESLFTAVERYCDGVVGVDEVYCCALPSAFPTFTSSLGDWEAFEVIRSVLRCIANPERRANLQLRHYRARPQVWTQCCNKEHCYRCQTKGFHHGRSCEEHLASLGGHIYDSSTVSCPGCGLSLAKGGKLSGRSMMLN